MKNKAFVVLCILVVGGLLAAGLWPFNPYPRNEVSWAPDGHGLQFGDYGAILGSSLVSRPAESDGSCSVEIWLTPGLTDDSNVILAFSVRDNPLQFRLGQNGSGLYVAREFLRNGLEVESSYIQIEHVFQQGKPVLLTLTAGTSGTEVYLNGIRAMTRHDFGLNAFDLTGNLVVANSPVENNSWSGLLQGIAFYDSELSATEVFQHYHDWSTGDRTILTNLRGNTLYLFREGAGKVVHNLGPSKQTDLYIPDHYLVLYPYFLHPFWKSNYLSLASFKDISINILGFAPLGFLLNALFFRSQSRRRSFCAAVLLGALLSLTIEVLQYFLPMRDSDSMDLLMNTLGTTVGAWLYTTEADRHWLARLPIVGSIWNAVVLGDSHA
jgi:VanZ family protein